MASKINWLLQNTSPGSLVLQSWLTRNNISPSLAFKYAQNGWLIKLRAGNVSDSSCFQKTHLIDYYCIKTAINISLMAAPFIYSYFY